MTIRPTARIIECTPDEYFAIPAFSSTVAKELIAHSPLHAKVRHGKEPTPEMDFGNVAHRLVLGKGKAFEVIEHDDFRTKAAQAARDKARSEGKIPIIAHAYERASLASEAVRTQLANRGILLDGESEVAIEWLEPADPEPVLCKAMLDHLWLDRGMILDLKITDNASPSSVERTSENMGYAIQWAAYTRAIVALAPELAGRTDFLFAFCEPREPYAMNLARPDGMFRDHGLRRWLRAVNTWSACLAADMWPGYGAGVNPLTVPGWAFHREESAT